MPHLLPDEETGVAAFECESCRDPERPGYADEATRAAMHCGYLDRSEWTGEDPAGHFGDEPYNLDVCPGWIVRQPAVEELTQAYVALEKGELDTVFPDPGNVVVEGALVCAQAMNRFQAYKHRERMRKARHE